MSIEDKDQQIAAYPVYDLSESLKVAEAIRDLGGSRATVGRELLGKHLKYAVGGPSFFQRVSSAKSFGLIDGRGTYSLSEKARRYFYPTDEAEKANAAIEILSNPPAFGILVHRFDGQKLPSNEILGNIIHSQAGIPISKKDGLAAKFVRAAQLLNLIDHGGILKVGAARPQGTTGQNAIGEATVASVNATTKRDPLDTPASLVATDEATPGSTVWSFSYKGNQIKVQTPEAISKELWEKLNAYVQILKPEGVEKT